MGERVPLHGHTDNNDGGRLRSSSVGSVSTTVVVSGASSTPTAGDVPIADTGAHFTATDVEAALAELATATTALDDLSDVDTTGKADQDVLTWDVGAGAWVAQAATGGPGGGDTSGVVGAGWDGGLAVLVAPHAQDVVVPFTGTLTGWRIYAPEAGTAAFGVSKSDYASFPTFTDIVGAGTAPGVTASDHAESVSLASWTTAVTAGDVLRFTLSSVSILRQVVLVMTYTRP
jgi:hypothetical protein